LRLKSGSRRVGRFVARHKKASIVGVVTGSVMAAGIAFAVSVLGGQVVGNIQNNGQQPQLQWVDSGNDTPTAPVFTGCVDQDGNADSTATGSASLEGITGSATNEQELEIDLVNVWTGEVCTFQGYLANETSTEVTVNGIDLSMAGSGGGDAGKVAAITTSMAQAPFNIANSDGAMPVTFTVTVPSGGGPIVGSLDMSVETSGWTQVPNPSGSVTPTS
jgi:hypothetical protein